MTVDTLKADTNEFSGPPVISANIARELIMLTIITYD